MEMGRWILRGLSSLFLVVLSSLPFFLCSYLFPAFVPLFKERVLTHTQALKGGMTIGTLSWLFNCLKLGAVTNPEDEFLHFPPRRGGVDGFSAHVSLYSPLLRGAWYGMYANRYSRCPKDISHAYVVVCTNVASGVSSENTSLSIGTHMITFATYASSKRIC